MDKKAGSRTLLLSILMSAPGPLVVGLGLLAGKSTTQLADFFRRSTELLAIVAAYAVYRATNTGPADGPGADPARKARLERGVNRFVGGAMCLSGGFMVVLAVLGGSGEKGNVLPGLAIALLGVIANTLFWLRYAKLYRRGGGPILGVQSRLYRAKALVDGCVSAVLLCITLFPGAGFTAPLDRAGSAAVALYLVWCGVKTVAEAKAPRGGEPKEAPGEEAPGEENP